MDGKRVNGMLNGTASLARSDPDEKLHIDDGRLTGFPHEMPPDIIHISHGFFPFTWLISRVTQQCWNDLSDLLAGFGNSQLADATAPSMELNKPASGKAGASQSDELRRRKLRLLEFCQAKRAEFIKLLVLSNWSRQAAEVSRLVDLQAFIRMRYDSYNDALALTAAMNRDLIRAQVATPDLKTSLEVLSASQVQTTQMLGFDSPRSLSPRKTLRILRKINRIIRSRLILNDSVPHVFALNFHVCDGRAKFIVPSEFQLDLSIAEEIPTSQYFFVDLKFLFTPISKIVRRSLLNTLDQKVNLALMDSGVPGCYDFLHNLTLTLKLTILFKQAVYLSQNNWRDALQADLLHRTLVVQYWVNKGGPKSWIEFRVSKAPSSNGQTPTHATGPSLCLRWVRDGVEASTKDVCFSLETLSMETILHSITSLHISHLLLSTFTTLRDCRLYALSGLVSNMQTSTVEPGACYLDLGVTKTRQLRITVDPVTGATILRVVPPLVEYHENEPDPEKYGSTELFSRICRLRSMVVKQEVESYLRFAGWEMIESQHVRSSDIRHFFPHTPGQHVLFSRHGSWQRDWAVAFTSSIDGDNWWIVQLQSEHSVAEPYDPSPRAGPVLLRAVHRVKSDYQVRLGPLSSSHFTELANLLAGMVEAEANIAFLAELYANDQSFPGSVRYRISHRLRVPTMTVLFRSEDIPAVLRIQHHAVLGGQPAIKETIRLSFHGIDSSSACAMVVARGQLANPSRHFSRLLKEDRGDISFSSDGSSFTMHYLVPVGNPMIAPLFIRLQQLELVLSSVDSLKARKLLPVRASLTRVSFAYGNALSMRASLKFNYHSLVERGGYTSAALAPGKPPQLQLSMEIRLPPSNPHRRIKESLVDILNSPQGGFDITLGLLTATIPLLLALEQICNPRHPRASSVHVTAHSAKVYQIWYPAVQSRFHISLGRRKGQAMWILRSSPAPVQGEKQAGLRPLLPDQLYSSKGDGWIGLSNGAAAEIHKVQHLIYALEKLIQGSVTINPRGLENMAAEATNVESKQQSDGVATHRDQGDVILID